MKSAKLIVHTRSRDSSGPLTYCVISVKNSLELYPGQSLKRIDITRLLHEGWEIEMNIPPARDNN